MRTTHGIIGRSGYAEAPDAIVAEIEPGDGTHYEFMWCVEHDEEFVRVAGLPDLKMYEYRVDEVLDCYERNRGMVGRHELPEDPYLGYIQGHSGKCNPWTAWAMVQCIAEHLIWASGPEYQGEKT